MTIARPAGFIDNGDFEQGLNAWHVVSGRAFANQPVLAATIRADKVEINGKPLVVLGGDFWHTPYPIGQNNDRLIRVVTRAAGILESDVFSISLPYLAYRLGGSAGGGVALELRVPALTAQTARLASLDAPDADGYVAVRIATPTGSDVLREDCWDLAGPLQGSGLLGATAKLRLRVGGSRRRRQRLLVDHIRMEPKPPPPFHPPLWGWADIHCHPMAQAGFGDLLAGHMHGPVEDLGSCLPVHGHEHDSVLHPASTVLEGGRHNDGSLAVPGWTTGTPGPDDQLGFRGWPAFDDLTHIKTHQAWIRRAYDGGQRLMVALVVHNQMLAGIASLSRGTWEAQSDRDIVEPQVQMLREFVVHNRDWCGLARTPDEARALIEGNRMAFVLGIETDSINGWINFGDFGDDPGQPNRDAIHTAIHDYFEYLHNLGVVQINLLHLSDNAFGGMALYDVMFVVNTWQRTGRVPATEDGFTGRTPDEQISKPVSIGSTLWEMVEPVATSLGIALPQPLGVPVFPIGDRNVRGLTVAGEVALVEAMRFGMVIDMDHMSEHSADTAFKIATGTVPGATYPLVSAHNGARKLAPRPLADTAPPTFEHRRNPHAWPSEAMKSETQLDYIKQTGGMFGHGTSGADSRAFGSVPNDCPGTSKTFAQGYQYMLSRLEMPVAFGTDWNALLAGPGPRFGPRAANGLEGELGHGDDAWKDLVREERRTAAAAQTAGVLYDTPIRDWRSYRFANPDLYTGSAVAGEGHQLWQAMALVESGVDLTRADVVAALHAPGALDAPALELALGMRNLPGPAASDFHRAGVLLDDPAIVFPADNPHVQILVLALREVRDRWAAMRAGPGVPMHRSTAGTTREFDFNLDGLAHYGLLPDMIQDLKNVRLSGAAIARLFQSAGRYVDVWDHSVAVGARIPH